MGRLRMTIAAGEIARARMLRAAGTSWAEIGARLGYHGNTIRRRLDPGFVVARHVVHAELVDSIETEPRITPEEAARALATVPVDTRTIQARFLGDPLPGRSALDKRRAW